MWIGWLSAFAVTQIIEAPIYAHALATQTSRGWGSRWAIALGASALTHPFIYLILPDLWGGGWLSYVLAAEAIAICVEALWLSHFGLRRAMLIALLANVASTIFGLALRAITGWP